MPIETELLRTGEVLVRFDGPLDRWSVPKIRKQVLRTGRNRAIQRVVADFSAVAEIDTAGIALLIELLRVLSRKDGKLELTGLSDGIRRIFRLARLEEVFEIQTDSPATSVQ